ncbi:MAG: hypothetical protein U0L20_09150 [Ruminococcus sp.]|nr:hypothetical protein [Ruminococcus sp.]
MKANNDIRQAAKKQSVKLWEIALYLGINDGNFSRKLRKELPQDEKEKIFSIIDQIAAEKENAACSATNTTNG